MHVLHDKKHVQVTKILLHKFSYFLSLYAIRAFKFEPYTYGPFSYDLASTLGSLIFWSELRKEGKQIFVSNIEKYLKDPDTEGIIERNYEVFEHITGDDFSFDNLECFGTALYCMDVVSSCDKKITFENVSEEFHGWKGSIYDDSRIYTMYKNI